MSGKSGGQSKGPTNGESFSTALRLSSLEATRDQHAVTLQALQQTMERLLRRSAERNSGSSSMLVEHSGGRKVRRKA